MIRINLAGLPSLCAEARRLIRDGTDPGTPVHAYRGATLCFVPLPLRWWAEHTTEERADRSIRLVRYHARNAPQGDGYAPHTAERLVSGMEGRA